MYQPSGIDAVVPFLVFLAYALPVVFMIGGLVIGSILESRHFESLRAREAVQEDFPAVSIRKWDDSRAVAEVRMVAASAVVSLDYCKRILAALRNIFGGRVRSYESLLDRARREAILRLKESAPGFDIIVNLRLDTSNIASVQNRRKGIGGVEVLASGTAIRYDPGDP